MEFNLKKCFIALFAGAGVGTAVYVIAGAHPILSAFVAVCTLVVVALKEDVTE